MDVAGIKRSTRAWLSGKPGLLQAVFWAMGKPYTEIAIFRSLIHPGDTVFDLGANTGQYTCLFCSLVGLDGAVHAFEPIPPTFAILEKNTASCKKNHHLFLNNLGVSDSEGAVTMFVSNRRFTEASMVRHSTQSQTESYPCPITTVDRYVDHHNIKNVALIKCDIEGAELLAMKGALSLLQGDAPPILFLEAWSGWTKGFGYQPAEFFSFLEREAGYHIYHVYKGGIKKISAGETLPADSFPDFLNFLCIIPPVHGNRIRALQGAGIPIEGGGGVNIV